MGFFDNAVNYSKDVFESFWRKVTRRTLLSSVINTEELILRWLEVYRGKSPWLAYDFVGLNGRKNTRRRRSLKMAKYVCKELASYVWSENPKIGEEDGTLNEWLEAQNFFNRAQKFTEYGAAAGGFAIKLRAPESGGLVVDFVPADYFIPVSWDNEGIYDADFISRYVRDKKTFVAVESHKRLSMTQYEVILTEYEEAGNELKNKKEISNNVINTRVPLFAYIPTPDVNNFDIDSPTGVSIFANALDTLYSLDIAFDALGQEIVLGKRRIIVPASAVKTVLNLDGTEAKYFDPTDEAYVAFNMKDADQQKIIDNTVELRIDQIVSAIKALLDILAIQTGFSAGTFSFDGQTVKTATEVISENTKTFKTKMSYENQLTNGMQKIFAALREIGGSYNVVGIPDDVEITWNDSIIEDRDSKGKYWNERYLNGTCTLEDVLVNVDGMTEDDAEEKAAEIKSGSATVDVTNLFGAGK